MFRIVFRLTNWPDKPQNCCITHCASENCWDVEMIFQPICGVNGGQGNDATCLTIVMDWLTKSVSEVSGGGKAGRGREEDMEQV